MTTDGQVLGTPPACRRNRPKAKPTALTAAAMFIRWRNPLPALTGELPFRGNARMLIKQVIHDDPPSPRKLNANISKDLETITLKCLEKDPNRRFSTAQELSQELYRFLSGEPIHSRPISRQGPGDGASAAGRRRAGAAAGGARIVCRGDWPGGCHPPSQAGRSGKAGRARRPPVATNGRAQRTTEPAKTPRPPGASPKRKLALARKRSSRRNLAEAREMAQRIAYARTISSPQRVGERPISCSAKICWTARAATCARLGVGLPQAPVPHGKNHVARLEVDAQPLCLPQGWKASGRICVC